MSHQAYGPRTGGARILRILDRQQVRATFFVPGYTAEHWPDAVRAVRDAGHEIGHHGYLHEGAHSAPDEATEERRLLRGLEALDTVLGVRPVGYRAPMWELTDRLPALLARHGFLYDSGLMDADHPYLLATGDETDPIVELPVPLEPGRLGAVQLPAGHHRHRASSPAPPTSWRAGPWSSRRWSRTAACSC